MIIYMATNKIDAMMYIGQTRNSLKKRISQHEYDSNRFTSRFNNAVKKYGIDIFDWIVLESCNNLKELDTREEHWITYYDAMNKGYNSNSGGHHPKEWLDSVKETRSKNVTGINNPMYRVPSPNTGVKFSEEHKQKISKAHLGKPKTYKNGNCKSVMLIESGEVFESLESVTKTYPHISGVSVGKCCRGVNKTAGGFTFKFYKPELGSDAS